MEIRSMSLGSWILGAGKADSPPGFEVRTDETEIKQEAIQTSQENVKEQTIDEPNARSTKPDLHTKRPVRTHSSDVAEMKAPSSDEAHLSADVAIVTGKDISYTDPAEIVAAAEMVAGTAPVPSADLELSFELAPMNAPKDAADLAVRIDQLNRGPVKGTIPTLLAAFQTLSADIANLASDFTVPTFDANLATVVAPNGDSVSPDGDITLPIAGTTDQANHSQDVAWPTTKQFASPRVHPSFDEADYEEAPIQAGFVQNSAVVADLAENDIAAPALSFGGAVDLYNDADLAPAGLVDAKGVPSVDTAVPIADLSAIPASSPIDPDLQTIDPVTESDLRHLVADTASTLADEADSGSDIDLMGNKVSADVEPNMKVVPNQSAAPSADVHSTSEDSQIPAVDLADLKSVPQDQKVEIQSSELEIRTADFIEGPSKAESADTQTGSWSRFDAPFVREQAGVKAAQNAPVGTAKLDEVQVKQVISQVIDRAEALAASRPKNGVTIHLRPQELGTITLFVKRTGAADVEAQMYASNDQVREALESNRGVLLQNLESKGLSIASVTVTDSPLNWNTNGSADSRTLNHGTGQARQPQHFAQEGEGQGLDAETIRQRIRSATGMDIWI